MNNNKEFDVLICSMCLKRKASRLATETAEPLCEDCKRINDEARVKK